MINASGSSDRRLAERDPVAAFKANVLSTFESIFDFKYGTYLLVSSTSVYGHSDRTTEDVEIDSADLPPYGLQKYLAELVVRATVPNWVIFRLGPLVGPGLRKNAIFDLLHSGRLYVHPDSAASFVDTRVAADAIWRLRERLGQIYNVSGVGTVSLRDVARDLEVSLDPRSETRQRDDSAIDTTKIRGSMDMPRSADAVRAFIGEQRRGQPNPLLPRTIGD